MKEMTDEALGEAMNNRIPDTGNNLKLIIKGDLNSPETLKMKALGDEYAKLFNGIKVETEDFQTELHSPLLEIWRGCEHTGITFCGLQPGKEIGIITSAIGGICGKIDDMPDYMISERIKNLKGGGEIYTFISKDCPGCPDVAKAANNIALMNQRYRSMIIDVDSSEELSKQYGVHGVPTVFVDGELLSRGHATLGQLVNDMERRFGKKESSVSELSVSEYRNNSEYEAIIAGGGPAGVTAAVFLSRKGIKTALICGNIGGQINETSVIENIITEGSVKGEVFASEMRKRLQENGVKVFDNREIVESQLRGRRKIIKTDRGECFESSVLIIATGAARKRLGIKGEREFFGKGVSYCANCDAPFYRGGIVAVAGGGNSGVETAIDLSAMCAKVYLFECERALTADEVLQKRVRELENVFIYPSTLITEIIGNDAGMMKSIRVTDVDKGEEKEYKADALFVETGLRANSGSFQNDVKVNDKGEIETDKYGRTNIAGVFAAGDVTDGEFKQIAIAMGEGATAALSAAALLTRGPETEKIYR